MDTTNFLRAYFREVRRIGLDLATCPLVVTASDDEGPARFLARLEALPPGASWRDVFGGGESDSVFLQTLTPEFRSLGAYDYVSVPCGPAVALQMPIEKTNADIQLFTAAVTGAGWTVHGAGMYVIPNATWPAQMFMLVLDISTTVANFASLVEWIDEHPAVELLCVARSVGAQFAKGSSG